MILSKRSNALLRLLRGEHVSKPSFREVWFAMHEFCRRKYGDYEKAESRIKIAQDLVENNARDKSY